MRNRFAALAALVAAGTLTWCGLARAGEEAPASAAPVNPAMAAPAEATAPAATASPTKTDSPVWSVLGWVAKQVAPNLECGCPGTPEGETAWRAWFDGKDVALSGLRDTLVADGWTADRTVAYFKAARAKMAEGGGCSKGACAKGDCAKGECAKGACAKGDCAKGDCADKAKDGCCQGKAERSDGKPCCGGCKKDKPASTETAKPEPAPETKP